MLRSTSNDVVVAGAGLVGPVASLFLARRGHRVELLESRSDPRLQASLTAGRSINLTLAERAWRAFRSLGIEDEVRRISVPLYGRRIHLRGGEERFHPYGPRGEAIWSVLRGRLNSLLVDLAAREPGVSLQFDQRVHHVDVAESVAEIEDTLSGTRRRVTTSPLILASGATSTRNGTVTGGDFSCQAQVMGIGYKELRLPAPRRGRALEPDALHLWPRGEHFFIAFPNPDGSFSGSLFLPHEGPTSFAALQQPGAVTAFFEREAPELVPLMPEVETEFARHPIGSLVTVKCAPWAFGDSLLLLGDAAHAIVPFLGQGLNSGLEDCLVLDALVEAHGSEWGAVFSELQRRRKPDCDALSELALRHFTELSSALGDAEHLRRQAVEHQLQALRPQDFHSPYNLISFTDMSYRRIQLIAARHDAVLRELMKIPSIEHRMTEPFVQGLIDRLAPSLRPQSS